MTLTNQQIKAVAEAFGVTIFVNEYSAAWEDEHGILRPFNPLSPEWQLMMIKELVLSFKYEIYGEDEDPEHLGKVCVENFHPRTEKDRQFYGELEIAVCRAFCHLHNIPWPE